MFGQVSLTSGSGCNQYNGVSQRSAQSLCAPADVTLDPGGSLWVVDAGSGNHRVLRYDAPLGGDNSADAVIGPASFTTAGSRCADPLRTASGFCFPDSVAFDPAGDLWVSESQGDRVLRFDQ